MQEGKKGLLVLTRYKNEAIRLETASGEVIEILVVQLKGKQVRIGVKSDKTVQITRWSTLEEHGGVQENTSKPSDKTEETQFKLRGQRADRPQTLADIDRTLLGSFPPPETTTTLVRPGLKKRKRSDLQGLSTEHATMPDDMLDSAVDGNR